MDFQNEQTGLLSFPGVLITFEGGEGAGKTTLINRLAKDLIKRNHRVIKTREPGGSLLGDQIRQWLLNAHSQCPIGQRAELLLFLAARAQHIEELILPSLHSGALVLCDRFNDSTIAYQGIARGLGQEVVQKLCDIVCNGLKPHLTLFLDVNPSIGLHRTKNSSKENAQAGAVDRIEAEKLEFHQKVHQAFIKLAFENKERIQTIDANRPIELVYQDIYKIVEQHLNNKINKQ